jgi:hypothetical protein
MGRSAVLVLLAFLVSVSPGCSTLDRVSDQIDEIRTPVTAEWAARETRVSEDEYQQSATLRGPDIKERIDGRGSYYRTHLRASVAKNGAATFQIYVATHLEDQWRNLNVAHDQDRIGFGVHKVSRKQQCGEDGCVFYEHIAMPASRLYLETRARDSVRLDVEGPGGAIQVVIPGVYVGGFLDRLARVEAAWKSKPGNRTVGARASYCDSKFAGNESAIGFCRKHARASYDRLTPARGRASNDSFTPEAMRLDACMRRHNGQYGIDWMMVDHCFQKDGNESVPAAPR